jgi:endoglucanase
MSWLTWSVADTNETCSMLLPRASSYGGWSEEDLKESGRLTRGYLRRFAGKTQEQRLPGSPP